MKTKFSFILAIFSVFVVGCNSCTPPSPQQEDDVAPSAPTLTASGTTQTTTNLSWTGATDNVGVTGYDVYQNLNYLGSTTATTYTVTGLAASVTYSFTVKAKDAEGNVSVASNAVSVVTLMPPPTAILGSGSYESSAGADEKVLFGNSIAKAFVLNVTNAGTARIDLIGAPVAYYWINTADYSDINAAASTLNSRVPVTEITNSSFTVNLVAGMNVICFKTAAYAGQVTNGSTVGLKVTLSNATITNAHYTADSSMNVAKVIKMKYGTNNNVYASSGIQSIANTFGYFQLFPYSDEAATVYDGTKYPKIKSLTLGMTTDWFSGSFSNFSSLDFENTAGSQGRNIICGCDDNGAGNILFNDSNATLYSDILVFQNITGSQITKSALGNFAYVSVRANVFNTSATNFGPASVCLKHLLVQYIGNPEIWIYAPSGVRIQ